MFEMTENEFEDWRSQFATSKSDKMGLRYKPMAFTEQGVAMFTLLNAQLVYLGLSSVLKGKTKSIPQKIMRE